MLMLKACNKRGEHIKKTFYGTGKQKMQILISHVKTTFTVD